MFVYPTKYDVIVVGAGHAGVEAALAAAKMGCRTLIITSNADSIGQMSCNPAIGGLAKGHLAREVDALGGVTGKCTDMSGLQFRMLNKSRGPAVWAPRAQCDKKAYQLRMKWICELQDDLDIKQGQCSKLLEHDNCILGIETDLGVQYLGKTVIITTGTFLNGLIHIGNRNEPGGRFGDNAVTGLSNSLKKLGIELGRLKTGTPPRLSRRSIDFTKMEKQLGETPVPYFTYWKADLFHMEQLQSNSLKIKDLYPKGSILSQINGQLPCYTTHTTEKTAEIVKKNLDQSPMYSGIIHGVGPRYCPSIEDKIVRFPEKDKQQLFLEPEGIATEEIYVNGFSTCLPFQLQVQMVRTIVGCENAEIIRPAYAVEYDFAYPTQLFASLESKVCENLFLAGQINGTSGYEEASAQGIMAGINAASKVIGRSPVVLRRDQAYIGVLIDDLITKGTTEPYRMFTSRAEHRLLLRQDNADQRLATIGFEAGLLPERNHKLYEKKHQLILSEVSRLENTRHENEVLAQILSRPEMNYNSLPCQNVDLGAEVIQQVEIIIKYGGYINRQQVEVAKFKRLEDKIIPSTIDFMKVPSMRTEARQKLSKIRPNTLGQAARISGVSPADISILMVWMKRYPSMSSAEFGEAQ